MIVNSNANYIVLHSSYEEKNPISNRVRTAPTSIFWSVIGKDATDSKMFSGATVYPAELDPRKDVCFHDTLLICGDNLGRQLEYTCTIYTHVKVKPLK